MLVIGAKGFAKEILEILIANNIDENIFFYDDINNSPDKLFGKYNILNSLKEAETYLGTPYRFGGSTRSGIDCSAFVLNVYEETTGLELPRVAAEQAELGERVERQQLQKGDLVFFAHSRRISHVGIVQEVTPEGEIKFIHAATSRGVMISSLNDSYWGPKFRFAKRILKEDQNIATAAATN